MTNTANLSGSFNPYEARKAFPALSFSGPKGLPWVFLDGPGGTQTPGVVAAAIASALTSPLSNRARVTGAEINADDITLAARRAGADLVNGDPGGIVFGRSMTDITFDIARTLAQSWGPGDEIVVTRLDHDGNVRPWVTYARNSGATAIAEAS